MATEYIQEGFYTQRQFFIDTHYLAKLAIAHYISKVTFMGDYSRVVYSSLDMAFRRRVETVDRELGLSATIKPRDLKLPYAQFYVDSQFVEDDRIATKQAYEAVRGSYIEELSMRIRSKAVKGEFSSTMFFSRDDDRRIAYKLWLFEKSMDTPLLFCIPIKFKNKIIEIPVNITVKSVDSAISYAEKDFLEKSRILPLKVSFTVRSYDLVLPFVDKNIALPYKFEDKVRDGYLPENEPRIAESFTLEMLHQKLYNPTMIIPLPKEKFKYKENNEGIKPEKTECEHGVVDEGTSHTYDMCKGFFSEPTNQGFNTYSIEDITETSGKLVYDFKDITDLEYIEEVRIKIPTREDIVLKDLQDINGEVLIDSLDNNSEYHIVMVIYFKDKETKTYTLNFSTLESPKNKAPTKKNKKYGKLVGMQF